MQTIVYLKNVEFELYRAALEGEISKDTFIKVCGIIKRATPIDIKDILKTEVENGGSI